MPGSIYSGSASWDDCGRMFSDKSCVSCFRIGSHTMSGQWHSQPTLTLLIKGVCVFRCNLPPALLAEWPGSFTYHCSNTGVEQTPNKSRHTKLTLKKKILMPFLLGFELATFWSQVQHSYQQALLDPSTIIVIGWKKNLVLKRQLCVGFCSALLWTVLC